MVPVAEGVWDLYGSFSASDKIVVRDAGKEYISLNIPQSKVGVCRLRINGADKSWSLVKIDKLALTVTEGGDTQPIEGEYIGNGVWSFEKFSVASARLRYRYTLSTDKEAALKYILATWDNAGSAPQAHTPEYLAPRALGEDEYASLFLKENRACWMFPEDKVGLLASITLNMNVPGQEIAYTTPHKGPKAVFIGDSITWQWARVSRTDAKTNIVIPLSPLPSFMTLSGDNVITRFHPEFFTNNNYVNRGTSGENTTQMLNRYNVDVLSLDPSVVVIMGGTNDLAQGYTKAQIVENIAEMASRAEALGMKVVLCSVTPCNDVYSRLSDPNTKGAHILALNVMIKALATSNGYIYCDYYPSLAAADGLALKEEYRLYDALHPNPDAYTVMEGIIKPILDSLL